MLNCRFFDTADTSGAPDRILSKTGDFPANTCLGLAPYSVPPRINIRRKKERKRKKKKRKRRKGGEKRRKKKKKKEPEVWRAAGKKFCDMSQTIL